jgi:putative ABC transport system substrate-binding protein
MTKLAGGLAVVLFAGAIATSASAQTVKKVDIITMNDTPQLLEVRDGLIKGLADHGYVDGKNMKVDFKSAQGNFGTAQQIVRQFIGDNLDVARAIDDVGWRRRCASYGVIDNRSENLQH